MSIYNKKRKKELISKKKLCKGFFCKLRGLMFKKKPDFGLIFAFKSEKKRSLHMWFVLYPIDVIFLDSALKVAEIRENLMPFEIYFPKKKSCYVIELPQGTIKKSGTKVEDTVSF